MPEIDKIIKDFYGKLPKFDDGRIDYHTSDTAPVITVFIECAGRILLLKRSNKVGNYRKKWSTVTGYLDELKPIKEKALEELSEEIAVSATDIEKLYFGRLQKVEDGKINKTWIIQPALAKLNKKPEIKLDFEHTEYKWIDPNELSKYDIDIELDKTFALVKKYFDHNL